MSTTLILLYPYCFWGGLKKQNSIANLAEIFRTFSLCGINVPDRSLNKNHIVNKNFAVNKMTLSEPRTFNKVKLIYKPWTDGSSESPSASSLIGRFKSLLPNEDSVFVIIWLESLKYNKPMIIIQII